MSRRVFIQKVNSDWLTENCMIAAKGFQALGFETKSFESEELPTLGLAPGDVVYGGINTTLTALKLLGVTAPKLINAHRVLPDYMGRKIIETTVGDLRQYPVTSYPCFIKPLDDNKLFDGCVVTNPMTSLIKLKRYSDELKLLVSELVLITAEYRCFVTQGTLLGVKHYKGGFDDYIDISRVHQAIKDYQNPPASYSLDFGVTAEGKTILIEINDGFGLGAYGLDALRYATMMLNRWDELTKS